MCLGDIIFDSAPFIFFVQGVKYKGALEEKSVLSINC